MKPSIVARSAAACQTAAWRAELARAFTRPAALLDALGLSAAQCPDLDPEPGPFGMRVPHSFAALMAPGDPRDPLLRQVLPLRTERIPAPGFHRDPVGDGVAVQSPGLLRKYAGRVLLMVHGGCAVHCRFCFRRHFPYDGLGGYDERVTAALALIGTDPGVTEVILSGGDPLLLDDDALGALLARLAALPRLRRLRLHTRLPVVLPARVTPGLCDLLGAAHPRTAVVIHANHPRELADEAADGLRRLREAGVTLLNQGVLLRGVNDDPDTLAELCERLYDCTVLPYYLHQLDPVAGAAHFAVPDATALDLLAGLRARLPGYLVPRLVREIAGAPSKVLLTSRVSLTETYHG
jgi:L-lysine 2,3-aminomutase